MAGLRNFPSQITPTYRIAPEAPTPKWTPEQEQQFQTDMRAHPFYKEFQQNYGEPPNLDGKDYNYRAAYAAGVRPERYAPDNNRYHWPSTTSTGLSLKAHDHPTAWMEDYMQITGGRDPNTTDHVLTPDEASALSRAIQYRYPYGR